MIVASIMGPKVQRPIRKIELIEATASPDASKLSYYVNSFRLTRDMLMRLDM